MSDFCKQCSIELFGKDFRELAELLPKEQYTQMEGASALCEGCGGFITVDFDGACRSTHCEKHGEENKKWFEAQGVKF